MVTPGERRERYTSTGAALVSADAKTHTANVTIEDIDLKRQTTSNNLTTDRTKCFDYDSWADGRLICVGFGFR